MNTNFVFQQIQIFWENIVYSFPQIFSIIVIFLLGWFFSKWIGMLVAKFLKRTWLSQTFEQMGWQESLNRIDTRLNAPNFFGEITRWSAFLFFLVAFSEIIGLPDFGRFLGQAVAFLPNVLISIIIFIIAVFLVNFSEKIVVGTLEKERITYSGFLGKILRWAIWFFAFLAIFYQLGISRLLILVLFIGMVGTASLVIGISFGLGGKELAKNFLEELKDKLSK